MEMTRKKYFLCLYKMCVRAQWCTILIMHLICHYKTFINVILHLTGQEYYCTVDDTIFLGKKPYKRIKCARKGCGRCLYCLQ